MTGVSAYERPYLYPKQHDAIFTAKRWATCEASTKSGKSQPLDAEVWTPYGPKFMGDINVGDYVLGADGKPKEVLAIFPQGQRQIYNISFADNTVVEADGEHLWEVHEYNQQPKLMTTLQLMQWPSVRRERAWIPHISPVEFSHKEVPLDPYMVGLLIGDGNLTTTITRFSSEDMELVDGIERGLPPGHKLVKESGDNYDWRITAGKDAKKLVGDEEHVTTITRQLGMRVYSHEKGIPLNYLFNDIVTRRAVLQGILDTDGFVDNRGQPHLEQTSWRLAKDVEILIQSMGGYVRTKEKQISTYTDKDKNLRFGRTVYRQAIILKDATWCFRLRRKKSLVRPKIKDGNRKFRNIWPSRVCEAKCISIDDPRHLYLTNGFVPTHNTVASIARIIEWALLGNGLSPIKPGQNYWWIAPVGDQARIAFNRVKQGLTAGAFIAKETPTPHIIMPTGSVIHFKSADNPDSLYGEDVYAAIIDEASRAKPEAWHAVRSTLTATRGPCVMIGNVKGRKNWFYEMCRRIESGNEPNGHFSRITWRDAVEANVLDLDEIEDAKRNLPEYVFKELYEAVASDESANPFGENHILRCVKTRLSDFPVVAWGLDLAKSQDYTVLIGLDEYGNVAKFFRWQHVPWRASIREVHSIVGEDAPCLVDSTGVGDPVLEDLQHEHGNFYGYNFTQTSKQRLMEGLAVSIQGGEIGFPDGKIKEELLSFEYIMGRTGVRYSAPEGYHDDCVCSLALARQQLVTAQPGQSLMAYMAAQAIAQKARNERAQAGLPEPTYTLKDPGRPLTIGDELREAVLDNELTALYNATAKQYLPGPKLCRGCGTQLDARERVTDGEFSWHAACAGKVLNRAA